MKSKVYFGRMRETSEMTDKVIFDALEPLKREVPGMYEVVVALPEKRRGLPKSRAHLARESYVACKGLDDGGWVGLAAAVGLEMNSMYYKNQVFDEKVGHSFRDRDGAIKNWLADSYSRDLADKVLQKSYPGNDELRSLLCDSNMAVCSDGAWIDLFQNVYSKVKDLGFDEQIALCDKRMYNINALYLEKIAMMGAIASGETDKTKISALANFGRMYGMGLQAVNDIADFVPPRLNAGTTEKTGHDAYRDVMFGKMTYPTIWLLNNGSERDRDLLKNTFEEGQDVELPQLEELTRTLVGTGAIDFAKRKVAQYSNDAKKSLYGNFSKKGRAFLTEMCVLFQSNRYYNALKEFE